jgi:hypothetical protein
LTLLDPFDEETDLRAVLGTLEPKLATTSVAF